MDAAVNALQRATDAEQRHSEALAHSAGWVYAYERRPPADADLEIAFSNSCYPTPQIGLLMQVTEFQWDEHVAVNGAYAWRKAPIAPPVIRSNPET